MKFLLVVAAVFGIASASNLRFGFQDRPRDLSTDLQEIMALFPIEEYREIGRPYLEGDEQVQTVVAYLQGDEWAALVATIAANEHWQNFKDFGAEYGVDVDAIVGTIHEEIASWELGSGGDLGGARAFVDEIRAATDMDAILAAINEKLMNSAEFQALYAEISSDAAREFAQWTMQLDQVQYIGATLREYGIDVDAVIEFIKSFLGWN